MPMLISIAVPKSFYTEKLNISISTTFQMVSFWDKSRKIGTVQPQRAQRRNRTWMTRIEQVNTDKELVIFSSIPIYHIET